MIDSYVGNSDNLRGRLLVLILMDQTDKLSFAQLVQNDGHLVQILMHQTAPDLQAEFAQLVLDVRQLAIHLWLKSQM